MEQSTVKARSKPPHAPRTPSSETAPVSLFRSRSIDSASVTQPAAEAHSSGTGAEGGRGGSSHEDKAPGTPTFVKTFRTLRKRLSRTSNTNKHESVLNMMKPTASDKDAAFKSTGEDSGASSAGEDFTQLTFSELPTSNPDLSDIVTPTPMETATIFKLNRSLPGESTTTKTAPSSDFAEKGDETSGTTDHASLSKTWSSSAFTGAQLRGTCSLEYAEHMKDKSHRRKAHMVDLRKDDIQHPPLPPSIITSTSKHAHFHMSHTLFYSRINHD